MTVSFALSKMTTVDVKLSRFERQPWGFRLHGGADFGSPLIIQKVNKGTFQALFITGDITYLEQRQK